MSPDVKRKYELKVGEGPFDISLDVRDIGDKVVAPGTVTGKSGIIAQTVYPEVGNPQMFSVEEIVTPTSEVASMTTLFETSVT